MKLFRVLGPALAVAAVAVAGCGSRELPVVSKGEKVTSLYSKGNLANPLNLKADPDKAKKSFARLGGRTGTARFGR